MDELQIKLFFNNKKKFNNNKQSMSDYFKDNKTFKDVFWGVYAMDEFQEINLKNYRKCLIVFNTVKRNERKLGHWLALYSILTQDGLMNVTFIDSFGLKMSRYGAGLSSYIKKYVPFIKKFQYNDFPLQSPNSYVCGAFICFISSKLVAGTEISAINRKFFKKFDRKFNDGVVVRFVKKHWYKSYCSHEFCPMQTYNEKCFKCRC